ncbi:MAG: Gfo/Idh/MocA family protein [Candidatus Heimdallarchaeaceae archaeon]
MEQLKVAVVGTGSWGKNHVRVYSELPNTKLVGIYDKATERAELLAKQHKVVAFSSLEDLLSREDINMVAIASPTTTHAEIALQVIEHGKHVFIEKPMTSTIEEAEKVIDAQKSANIKVGVGFIERFNPVSQRSKQLIEKKELGDVVLIGARRLGPYWPDRLKDVDVVRDVSIHDIDGFRFMTKKDPISIYARGGKLRHRYYDYAEILLDFGEGVTGFIESNYLTPHKFRKLMITCEHGIVEADFMTQEYVVEDEEFVKKRKIPWKEPLSAELSAFVDACLQDKLPPTTSVDGIKALKIAIAAMHSIETHKAIELDL